MPLSLICASHTPLLHRVPIDAETTEAVAAGFDRLAEHVRAFDPDFIVQFSPDHFQGFFHRLMPSFCVGLAARSAEDWDIPGGAINVPPDTARALVRSLFDQGFDVAVSRDMVIDHGFLQIWQETLGSFAGIPLIPIFVNCVAQPTLPYRRVRALGEAVGRFALATGKRVMIVASGGLSHDPPVPDVDSVPAEIRERLITGAPRSAGEKVEHEGRLAKLGETAGRGEGPCGPLNPDWDRQFLGILESGDLAAFDAFDPVQIREDAGRAANEIMVWVAACAALSVAGPFEINREFYQPIPAWIAGMAMVTGTSRTGGS